MNTLGEFMDHVEQKGGSDASIWINVIMHREGVTDSDREEYRAKPFDKKWVVDFALAIAGEGRAMIASGSSDDYIRMLWEEVHTLLRLIYVEARELGILCGETEIDVPLSPSEAIIRAAREPDVPA